MHVQGRTDINDALPAGNTAGAGGATEGDETGGGADEGEPSSCSYPSILSALPRILGWPQF